MKADITGKTRLACLIGDPVSYSMSPTMHNFSYEVLGLDYVYTAFRVSAQSVEGAMDAVRALGIVGCNVTMPCKTAVIKYLDHISPEAQLIGAVNTIVNNGGILTGYNTDGKGMTLSITKAGGKIKGSKICLIGAGGAGCSIMVAAAMEGAAKLSVVQKNPNPDSAAGRIINNLRKITDTLLDVINFGDKVGFATAVTSSDIIINATPLGMNPNSQTTPIEDRSLLKSGQLVADAVYSPRETRLLREAKAAGCKVVDGTGMLLWQGAEGFRMFTGKDMPVDEVANRVFGREE